MAGIAGLRVVALCCILFFASCRGKPDQNLPRIALLPGNVLAPDAPLWMRAAVPLVLQHDLSASPSVFSLIVNGDSEAYKSGATEALEVTVDRAGETYSVSAGLRSLSSQRIQPIAAGNATGALIPALDAIAKSVDSRAAAFGTRNEVALGSYISALEATDAATRMRDLQEAVREAPGFGAAQVDLIAVEAQTGAPDLSASIAAAQAHRSEFDTLDGARFDAVMADVVRKPIAEQAAAAAAVIRLDPNNPDMLANLGRDRFLLGDAAGGERYLQRAMMLRGNTPQLRVELLRGLVETRQFPQAAQMLAQQSQTVAGALEQASCWLLAGDAAKAAGVAAYTFKAQSAADPLATLRRAEWMAANGDVAGAAAVAGNAGSGDADANAAGQAQAAIWNLQLGRRADARQLAESSTRTAISAGAKQAAAIAALLASSNSGDELRARLGQAHNATANTVLAFGLFLYGDYAGAAEAWRTMYEASGQTDLQSRILLAACYARMNRNADAAAVHALPVLPNLTGADPFATVTFGEMRRLLHL